MSSAKSNSSAKSVRVSEKKLDESNPGFELLTFSYGKATNVVSWKDSAFIYCSRQVGSFARVIKETKLFRPPAIIVTTGKARHSGLPAIIVTSETVIRILSSPICSSIKFMSFRHSIRTIQMQLRGHSRMTSHK